MALTPSFPVDVLMKSAPKITQTCEFITLAVNTFYTVQMRTKFVVYLSTFTLKLTDRAPAVLLISSNIVQYLSQYRSGRLKAAVDETEAARLVNSFSRWTDEPTINMSELVEFNVAST